MVTILDCNDEMYISIKKSIYTVYNGLQSNTSSCLEQGSTPVSNRHNRFVLCSIGKSKTNAVKGECSSIQKE